jgi:flagellar biosynthesis protein FlhG
MRGDEAMQAVGEGKETAACGGARTIAVASGKGGVGKTNFVANLAVALGRRGRRVVVVDADLGLGNVDALLGLPVRFTLRDVLEGRCALADTVVEGPGGVRFVPAPSGHEEMTRLSAAQATRLLAEFGELEATSDFLFIDTGAGISSNVLFFAIAAHETIVLLTPEPTSLTDAYALIKVLATRYGARAFDVFVNLARNREEALRAFGHLAGVAERFLRVDLRYRGFLPQDGAVGEAVRRQRSLLDFAPGSAAARALERLAAAIASEPVPSFDSMRAPLLRGISPGEAA